MAAANRDYKRDVIDYYKPFAVLLTRVMGGRTQYRVAPQAPFHEGQVPLGGYLSKWCSTEERAWRAAACHCWWRAMSRY